VYQELDIDHGLVVPHSVSCSDSGPRLRTCNGYHVRASNTAARMVLFENLRPSADAGVSLT
jgi:hypothetical protein